MSKAVWIPEGSLPESSSFTEARLGEAEGYDEAWLQELLFERPELIPIETVDPGSTEVIPICRELPLAREGATVFLDILGVTRTGRLVLVECKLWRNPQARREVIGQILEYAAILQGWSYGDLTAHLKKKLGWKGKNPLFEHVNGSEERVEEASFVDAVARSLKRGEFNLIVAGDGIRSGIRAIKSYLDIQRGLASRLALVEFRVWTDGSGGTFVTPHIPLRTTVIEHRIIVDRDDVPLQVETVGTSEEEIETRVDPEAAARLRANRAFWQQYIDTMELDHPDQRPRRHGGNNWVTLDLPDPSRRATIWRSKTGEVGIAARFTEEGGDEAFEALREEAEQLRKETGLALCFEERGDRPPGVLAMTTIDGSTEEIERRQLEWIQSATNSFVNAFRPRLAAWSRESEE